MKASVKATTFNLLSGVILVLVGIAIYSNSFQVPFQFDDRDFVNINQQVENVEDVYSIYTIIGHPARFLSFYSFVLNHKIHGLKVFSFGVN